MPGGGSSQSTNVPAPSPEERALTQKQLDIAGEQLTALQRNNELVAQQNELAGPLVQKQAALLDAQYGDLTDPVNMEIARKQQALTLDSLDRAKRLAPAQDEITQLQLDDLRRGGAASPDQLRNIEEAGRAAVDVGTSDIRRSTEENLRLLREELAPSLGLSSSDSPILDRGARLSAEGVRQEGQLARDVAGAGATARLNLPLAQSQLTQAGGNALTQRLSAASDFQAQLREAAGLNRLRLAGAASDFTGGIRNAGLSIASGAGYNLNGAISSMSQARLAGADRNTSTDQTGTYAGAGIGAAATVGAAFI